MLTKDAVAHFKGRSKLAKELGISPAAVSQWGEHVPKARQYQLQVLSDGALKVADDAKEPAERRRSERRQDERRQVERRA